MYFLQKNSKYLIDTTKLSGTGYYHDGNDFTVIRDTQIIVGYNKLIEMVVLKDSSIKVISEFSYWSFYLEPEKIGDGSYLFFSGGDMVYLPFIYRTDDNGITFKPTFNIPKGYSPYNRISLLLRFKYVLVQRKMEFQIFKIR